MISWVILNINSMCFWIIYIWIVILVSIDMREKVYDVIDKKKKYIYIYKESINNKISDVLLKWKNIQMYCVEESNEYNIGLKLNSLSKWSA